MKDEEYPLASIIEDLKYPSCPKCKSKDVAVSSQHSACLGSCKWIGDTSSVLRGNVILKSMITQEGFINLSYGSPNGLKKIAQDIAKKKRFPGADEDPETRDMGDARCFIRKFDEFGEENDIEEFMESTTKKSFRLGMFNHMEKISSLTACAMHNSTNKQLKRFAGSRVMDTTSVADISDSFLLGENGKVNPALFRKKSAIEVDNRSSDEFMSIIDVYSCCYGRPDTFLHAKYTKTASIIQNEYPSMGISKYAMIWQPFYWPSINLESDDLIHLAGVIQAGDENITYIVTESMDTGAFNAGVYKRKVYENGVNFIKSKAANVRDAISRLRTSFEKTVLSIEKSGGVLDFSWLEDWPEDTPSDTAFFKLLTAPFWDESIASEMLHLIGYSKQQILQDMYNETKFNGN